MSFVKWCELCQSEGIQSPVCLFQINFTEAVQMCKRPECLDLVKARNFRSLVVRRDLPRLPRKVPVSPPHLQTGAAGPGETVRAAEDPSASVQDDLEAFLTSFDDVEPQHKISGASTGTAEKSEIPQDSESVDRRGKRSQVQPEKCSGQGSELWKEEDANASRVDVSCLDRAQIVGPDPEDVPLVSAGEPGGSGSANCGRTVPVEVAEHSYTKVVGASTDTPPGFNAENAFLSGTCTPEALNDLDFEMEASPANKPRLNRAKDSHSLPTDGPELAIESPMSTIIHDTDAVALCTPDDTMTPCLRIADSMYHAGDGSVHNVLCIKTVDDAPVIGEHFIFDLGASVDVTSQEMLSVREPATEGGSQKQNQHKKSRPTDKVQLGLAAIEERGSGLVPSAMVASKVQKPAQAQDLPKSSWDANTLGLSLPVGNVRTVAFPGRASEGEGTTLGMGGNAQKGQPTVASGNGVEWSALRTTNVAGDSSCPAKRTWDGDVKNRANRGIAPGTTNCDVHQSHSESKVEHGTSQGKAYYKMAQVVNGTSGNRGNARNVTEDCTSSVIVRTVGSPPRSRTSIGLGLSEVVSPMPLPCVRSTPVVLNKLAMISTVLKSTPLPKEARHSSPPKKTTPQPKPKGSEPVPKGRSSRSCTAPHLPPEKKQRSSGTSKKRTAPQPRPFFPPDLPGFSSPLRSPSGSEDGSLSSKPSSGSGSDGMHRSGRPGDAALSANMSSSAFVRMVKDQIRAKRDGGSGFPGYHPILAKKPPYNEEKKPRRRTQRKTAAGQDTLATELDRIVGQMGNVEDCAQYDSILNELFQMA